MSLLDKFDKVKILVIGDIMIDRYFIGDVNRISPEAPVPVVKLKKTNLIAGGAANVAANIAGLKGTPILLGISGDDPDGELLPEILECAGVSAKYIFKIKDRKTTVKTRILAHNQQIVRIDQEEVEEISQQDEETIWKTVRQILDEIEVIIMSDYKKGFLTQSLVSRLITFAISKGKKVLVDPKGRDYTKYAGATALTPNKFEVAEVFGGNGSESELIQAGKKLKKQLKLEALLITRGEEGMMLFETGKKPASLRALARHVYDVTGAGDTVIATLAMALGAGAKFPEAAEIANTAAGLVVEEVGTSIIKWENLKGVNKL